MNSGDATNRGVVIVGVDGSEASKEALRWALRYAHMAGVTVHALTAWQYPSNYAWAPGILDQIDPEGDAERTLKETVGEVTGLYPDVTVQSDVVHGFPGLALVGAATRAELLVVGSRGHGTFAGMLLGSVSEHCVHHAKCPVMVVHHASPPPPPPATGHR